MQARLLGAVIAGVLVGHAEPATAQVVGTFSWQTQPHCNVVSVTVVQQGGSFQLTGVDNLCGSGAAPVTGTALLAGNGVVLGFTVSLASGRAAHLTATVNPGTLSGSWSDDGGATGAFVFAGSGGGSPRPAPSLAPGLPMLSTITYTGTTSRATSTVSPGTKFRDLGTFTSSGGPVKLTWRSHVTSTGVACNFQIRVDGQPSSTPSGLGLVGDEAITQGDVDGAPVSVITVFPALPAGQHMVELWLRSVSGGCIDNQGNYQRTVLVEEYRPGS